MRIIVFSDIHGNSRAIHKIIDRNKDVSQFIFLGDGAAIVDRIALAHKELEFHIVSGNCDYASLFPYTDILSAEGKKILFCHGHTKGVKYGVDELAAFARSQKADVVLFGHTHCRFAEYSDGLYIFNPGSACCPRDGKSPCYLFLDITKGGIAFNHVDL